MKIYFVNLKRIMSVVSFVMLLVLSVGITFGILYLVDEKVVAAYAESSDYSKVIILDAGHGGEDSGAVGVNGALEKDLNLDICNLIAENLRNEGYTVILTREEDKMLYSEEENIKGMRKLSDLKNRVKMIEKHPGATFVSIHMNSFGASKYSGLQVYYKNQSDASEALAASIQNKVKELLQPDNNRKTKSGNNIYILENSPITSVLIECGFLTNSDECQKLSEKEYQKQLSFAISCGIIEYIEK